MPSRSLSRRSFLAGVGATALGGCTAQSSEESTAFDWPQFGRTPAKTNAIADANLAVSDGTPDWSRPIGGGIHTSLVTSDGLVYFGTDDGLVAHRAAEGDQRWRNDLRGTPTGTPAASDGIVVGTSVEQPADPGSPIGEIAAFDLSSGDRQWHRDLPDAEYIFSPTIADEAVVVRTATRALGLDLASGETSWELDGLAAFDDPTYPGLADLAPALDEGVAYIPDSAEVVAYDTGANEVVWRRTLPKVRSAPAVAGEHLFVSSTTAGVYALDASSGDVEWHWKATGCWTTPAVTPEAIYATANGVLVALDRDDGTERWRVDLHGDSYSAPLVVGETVVGSSIGRTAVGVDTESGEQTWTFVGNGTRSTPTAADGTLYVPDGGSLVAIDD